MKKQYNREEMRTRREQIAAIIVWAVILVAVVVRWAVSV